MKTSIAPGREAIIWMAYFMALLCPLGSSLAGTGVRAREENQILCEKGMVVPQYATVDAVSMGGKSKVLTWHLLHYWECLGHLKQCVRENTK